MSGDWRPALSDPRAAEALEVARDVGTRLADPDRLARAIESAPKQTEWPEYAEWKPIELAQGHPGLALLFGQLDTCFPGEGWRDAACRQLDLAVEALRRERGVPGGLLQGLAGVAFSAAVFDPVGYRPLLETLDGLLVREAERTRARLDAHEQGCAEEDFDLVSGLAGIGAYFLTRGDEESLKPILERLVGLVCADGPAPAWHTPSELIDDSSRERYPEGRLNCGLAHGLPGPLALMALSSSDGVEVEGLAEAIERASAWLVEAIVEDEWGVNWPAFVPLGRERPAGVPTRAAWCYGAPGVSRALRLAGAALDEQGLQELAVGALEAVYRRPPEERRIDAPTLCHGLAGLLQITLRTAADSGSRGLRAAAAELAGELVGRFEPASVLSYRDLDPDGRPIDQAGLLQGAAGTALALLAAAAPAPPRWDRMFLLA